MAFGVSGGIVAADAIDDITPVTDEMLLNPSDNDWLMWRRTYDGWGYSPLDQINKDNVSELRLAWAWDWNGRPSPGSSVLRVAQALSAKALS